MALTDAQIVALGMFEGDVPCILSLDNACSAKAEYLISLDHKGADCGKLTPNPSPYCAEHKEMIVTAFNPFWRTFLSLPPTLCPMCETETGLGEVTKI